MRPSMADRGIRRFMALAAELRGFKWLEAVGSGLLILAAIWAAASMLPSNPEPVREAAPLYHAARDVLVWRRREAPVFAFDSDLFPRQCGKAVIDSDGNVRIIPYRRAPCLAPSETGGIAVLHRAGPQLLWTLIPEAERENIGSHVRHLVGSIGSSISGAVGSRYFERVYRADLADILSDAMRVGWRAPDVQAALTRAVNDVDPAIVDRLVDGVLPIAIEKAESSVWAAVQRLAGSMIGRGGDRPAVSPMTRAIRSIFEDPRVHDQLLDTLPELAGDPKVSVFATRLASAIVLALIDDPRVPVLVMALLTDPQLMPSVGIDGRMMTHDLPQWLLRYRHPKDHNPLIAFVVASIVRGDGAYVALMLTEEQAAALHPGLHRGIPLIEGGA